MKQVLVALIGCALCATAVAQATAPANDPSAAKASSDKSKQEVVKSTTESQTKQMSGAGYHGGPMPTAEAKKLSDQEKQQVMSDVEKSAKDQYRPSPPPKAAAAKKAPKARPRMSDPDMQEQIKNQQRS